MAQSITDPDQQAQALVELADADFSERTLLGMLGLAGHRNASAAASPASAPAKRVDRLDRDALPHVGRPSELR